MKQQSLAGSENKTALRWVLAHEPVTTFEAAARRFSELLDRAGAGIETKIFSAADYGRRLSPAEVVDKVAAGEIEMCQTYTAALGRLDDRLLALDLPYLFRDHEHVARALDGETGASLLTGLVGRGLRGLAFTYSGGYRVVATTGRTLESAADMAGLRLRTGESPVPKAFFAALGARPVPASLDRVAALAAEGAIDAAEATFPRYWDGRQPAVLPHVVESRHSVLLTMMVVNERFYQGLSSSQRDALHGAARQAAVLERATSIAEGEQVKARCAVSELPAAEERRWREAGERVRRQFAPRFGESLVASLAR